MKLKVLWNDLQGLNQVCGLACALRWLVMIAIMRRECRQAGDLLAADTAMGEGPFRVRLRRAQAKLVGPRVFSGIREIWVRDVYLGKGYLRIPPQSTVVDLGANMGNFTNLALAHSPNVRVVAVEPNAHWNSLFRRSVGENGWLDRVTLVSRFIGGITAYQKQLLVDPNYQEAGLISQEQFLTSNALTEIDFLKCDIEGSEFELLMSDSPILARTKQLAVEIHDFAGDRAQFLRMLEANHFQVKLSTSVAEGCVALAKRVTL